MSIEKGVPLSDYMPVVPSYDTPLSDRPSGYLVPQGYTVDPNFKMPTVSEPPEEPATPPEHKFVLGFDPGSSCGVLAFREGDKVLIVDEVRGWKQVGVIGGTMADGVQYKKVKDFDEDHIVRGYD